jgi:hypothetical protein
LATLDQSLDALRSLLVPKLDKIVKLMHEETNPLLLNIPDSADGLSEDQISELIAQSNNNVNKASELMGAAYAAFKICYHTYELTFKKNKKNDGKNEDEREAIAMQIAEEAKQRLALSEGCFHYISSIFSACEVNSQSARKLVDNFHTLRQAEARDSNYGKPPEKGSRY